MSYIFSLILALLYLFATAFGWGLLLWIIFTVTSPYNEDTHCVVNVYDSKHYTHWGQLILGVFLFLCFVVLSLNTDSLSWLLVFEQLGIAGMYNMLASQKISATLQLSPIYSSIGEPYSVADVSSDFKMNRYAFMFLLIAVYTFALVLFA